MTQEHPITPPPELKQDLLFEGRWYWVRLTRTYLDPLDDYYDDPCDGWEIARHDTKAAGGWTNDDIWEDFDKQVFCWRLIPLPEPIKLDDSPFPAAHPITPPPELVEQWWDGTHGALYEFEAVTTQAARWGADQELEACCADIRTVYGRTIADWLRSLRRSKPPSLKQQALDALGGMPIEPCLINGVDANASVRAKYNIIRQALEQLDD
jgi:hypothetical protein